MPKVNIFRYNDYLILKKSLGPMLIDIIGNFSYWKYRTEDFIYDPIKGKQNEVLIYPKSKLKKKA